MLQKLIDLLMAPIQCLQLFGHLPKQCFDLALLF